MLSIATANQVLARDAVNRPIRTSASWSISRASSASGAPPASGSSAGRFSMRCSVPRNSSRRPSTSEAVTKRPIADQPAGDQRGDRDDAPERIPFVDVATGRSASRLSEARYDEDERPGSPARGRDTSAPRARRRRATQARLRRAGDGGRSPAPARARRGTAAAAYRKNRTSASSSGPVGRRGEHDRRDEARRRAPMRSAYGMSSAVPRCRG